MSKRYFIGEESSNGNLKATSNVNPGKVDKYLNTVTIANEHDYVTSQERIKSLNPKQRKNRNKSNDVYEIKFPLKQEPYYYKVGKRPDNGEARGFSTSGKKVSNTSKYSEDDWIASNIIAVYRQLEDEDFERTQINLVTGLPTVFSKNTQLKDDIITALTKTYTINGKVLRISNVSILPQADASFFNDLFDLEGNVNEEFLEEVSVKDEEEQTTLMYYDIGYGTTDVKAVIEYAIDPKRKAELDGMEKQYLNMKAAAVEKNGLLEGTDLLVLEKQLREHGYIEIEDDGISEDITTKRELILEKFAEKIVNVVDRAEFSDLKVNQHRFCGGGSIVMEKYIMKALQKKYTRNPSQIDKYKFIKSEDEEYPIKTNCLGFYKMCVKKYDK
jgi:molecular chaperone GrpE (heat shock protein)